MAGLGVNGTAGVKSATGPTVLAGLMQREIVYRLL